MASEVEKLEENQQEILETLNNGLKSKVKENSDNISFLIKIIISGLGAVIMFLAGIVWQLSQMGGG